MHQRAEGQTVNDTLLRGREHTWYVAPPGTAEPDVRVLGQRQFSPLPEDWLLINHQGADAWISGDGGRITFGQRIAHLHLVGPVRQPFCVAVDADAATMRITFRGVKIPNWEGSPTALLVGREADGTPQFRIYRLGGGAPTTPARRGGYTTGAGWG